MNFRRRVLGHEEGASTAQRRRWVLLLACNHVVWRNGATPPAAVSCERCRWFHEHPQVRDLMNPPFPL